MNTFKLAEIEWKEGWKSSGESTRRGEGGGKRTRRSGGKRKEEWRGWKEIKRERERRERKTSKIYG